MITLTRSKQTALYIQRAIDAGFEVIAYYFETDLKSTFERNSYCVGNANIPKVGVLTTYKKLEVPRLDEGFDEMFRVKIVGNGEFSIYQD